jgi:hypothetical protein
MILARDWSGVCIVFLGSAFARNAYLVASTFEYRFEIQAFMFMLISYSPCLELEISGFGHRESGYLVLRDDDKKSGTDYSSDLKVVMQIAVRP